jgi:hypothetical protein
VWLAELTECGLLRGSFIPPPQIAAIRELTRHRKKLIEQRASELQRLGKVAAGDLLPQHRSHDVLEIVVVDSSDRLETDGGGMSNICLNPVSGPLCAQGGHRVGAGRRWFDGVVAYFWRNIASVSAMSAISCGCTLSLGAWISDRGSSTPIRMISASG